MALFTDYHIGKSRDAFYTSITINYLDWFIEQVTNDPTIDSIGFLGDWHEIRNTIPIETLNISDRQAEKLNNIGKPVFFLIGNHDLATRSTRDIHSCITFRHYSNFIIIDQPQIFDCFDGGALFSPFLFHNEYDLILPNRPVSHLLGHFEFKDFVITGYNTKMEHGPDCTVLSDYRAIISGHFHKRQRAGNVTYIGNTFATSFADANDSDRGMAIYNFDTASFEYKNWEAGPRFVKTTLSKLSSGSFDSMLNERTFIRCIADYPITYEEHLDLKQSFTEQLGVKEVVIEEDNKQAKELITEALPDLSADEIAKSTIDELVIIMLDQIKSSKIDNKTLITLYKSL